jgi:hypothetical protein
MIWTKSGDTKSGLEAVYSKPRLSQPGEGHKIYPYGLQQAQIE